MRGKKKKKRWCDESLNYWVFDSHYSFFVVVVVHGRCYCCCMTFVVMSLEVEVRNVVWTYCCDDIAVDVDVDDDG